tara:strand:- start:52 stop:591 length:540 start_codon:yes stop_codon:yes gene_type:complete
MALVIKGSTSGQVTIDVPAEAGTNTLTIPATTGTVLDTNSSLSCSKLSGALPALNAAALTNLAAAQLSGTLPSIDGSNLTGIVTGLTASAFSENQNGYLKLSNNWLIQWGRASSLANGGARTVNFPLTFPSACWAVAASWGVYSSGSWHSAFPDINTTRFTAHNVSGVTQSCWFVAVGK